MDTKKLLARAKRSPIIFVVGVFLVSLAFGLALSSDPRHPDAYGHPLYNECVGTSQLFTYALKNGDVETTYITEARGCGGDGSGEVTIIQEGKGIVAGEGAEDS